jgi:hypothetical protein
MILLLNKKLRKNHTLCLRHLASLIPSSSREIAYFGLGGKPSTPTQCGYQLQVVRALLAMSNGCLGSASGICCLLQSRVSTVKSQSGSQKREEFPVLLSSAICFIENDHHSTAIQPVILLSVPTKSIGPFEPAIFGTEQEAFVSLSLALNNPHISRLGAIVFG